ncbi:MAG: alanine racemase [Dehalococcoidia bacterium]|nr:alanine racemase [Dehalococcoidia bacterium]
MTTSPGRPLWAEIDLDAIAHNVRLIVQRMAPASVMAVVKANAYGHGAVPVARAVLEAGAIQLAVACVDEGVQLRRAGIMAPIAVVAYAAPGEAEAIVANRLTPAVIDEATGRAFAAAAKRAGVRLQVHLEVDTGMARFGVRPEDVPGLVALIRSLPELELVGMYTHYATADTADKTFTRQQYQALVATTAAVGGPLTRHVANSATVLDTPDMKLDMARPGMAIYGYQPSGEVTHSLELHPSMQLKATVGRVHTLPAGETVSYGRTWTAPRDSRIALIPCGYADGIPRLASNRGAVLVRGQRAPIRGRVCMDQFMVDVTDIPGATAGDEAVIVGTQGSQAITWEEVGAQASTINYEIVCALAARVPRVYLRGGQVVETTTLLG